MREKIGTAAGKIAANGPLAENLLARTQGMVLPLLQAMGYDVFDLSGVKPGKGENNTIEIRVAENGKTKIRVVVDQDGTGSSVPDRGVPVSANTNGLFWTFLSADGKGIGSVDLEKGLSDQDFLLLESLCAGMDAAEAVAGVESKLFADTVASALSSMLDGKLPRWLSESAAKAAGLETPPDKAEDLAAVAMGKVIDSFAGRLLAEREKAASELDETETSAVETFLAMAGNSRAEIEIKKTTGYIALLADNNVRRWLCRIYLAGKTRVLFKDGTVVEFNDIGELSGMKNLFLAAMASEGLHPEVGPETEPENAETEIGIPVEKPDDTEVEDGAADESSDESADSFDENEYGESDENGENDVNDLY